jgi:SAM-dependent methyltransferase
MGRPATHMTDEVCRSCGAGTLDPIVSLGPVPLANAVVAPSVLSEPDPYYPLDLVLCRSCGLVQITETVPPEILFADYPYFSSMSQTMLDHAADLATRVINERKLAPANLVVEVASNDGYLLQYYKAAGIRVMGIEPARNIAIVAEQERGIRTLPSFFTPALACKLKETGTSADMIHAHNVLAHIPYPRDFIAGFTELLAPDGLLVVEVPYVKNLIERIEFDTIYHEHYSYFSLTSLVPIFATGNLEVVDVERVPIHGGSLLLFVSAAGRSRPSPRVAELLSEEKQWGAKEPKFYESFAQAIASLGEELRQTLESQRAEGKRIAAYGASAKACVLLNHFGIGSDLVEFVVDRSPAKQGRFIPGVRIPIRPVKALTEEMPDSCLLLVWNIAEEVLRQQASYRSLGGKFIIPLPKLTIV